MLKLMKYKILEKPTSDEAHSLVEEALRKELQLLFMHVVGLNMREEP